MDRQEDRQVDKYNANRQMTGLLDRQMAGLLERQMSGLLDRFRWIVRQIDGAGLLDGCR